MKTKSMASPKLNAEEKKDLDKFTKFLALKAAQIIVQSRLGEKVHSQCKPNNSGTDWFNLAVRDLPDVLAEAKSALCCDVPTNRMTLCVDISLKTVEGDTMMLETWNLGVLPDECDSNVRVTYTVYNRMGLLLKTLVTVTRVTPAYKLSRRQSPDSYVICYRIYMGEPQLGQLGEGFKQVQVGQLCTPIGTIQLTVSYRTKMTISPQAAEKEASIMVKSDHFAPKSTSLQSDEMDSSGELLPLKIGAFANVPEKTELEYLLPEPGFTSLLPKSKPKPKPKPPTPPPEVKKESPIVQPQPRTEREKLASRWSRNTSQPSSKPESRRSSFTYTPNVDTEFFMLDFKPPFATPSSSCDLGTFYKECQLAPPLQEFEQQPTFRETVSDLGKQIKNFELSAPKYDEMLSNLLSTD